LGNSCTVASVLRAIDLRKSAYPFDWMFSKNFEAIYNAIKDDFKLFLNPHTLKIGADPRIIIDHYGFEFVHDFPTIHNEANTNDKTELHEWNAIRHDWKELIEPIREKYKKRINRLRKVLNGPDRVLLIRYTMQQTEAVKLRDLVLNLYPNLNFTIVVISENILDSTDWNLEKIRNFFVSYNNPDFYNAWRKIFIEELNVNPNSVRQIPKIKN